jgi:hypothetical protein
VEVGPVSEGLDDRHDSGAKALLLSYRRRQELLCRLCRQPRERAQKLTVVQEIALSSTLAEAGHPQTAAEHPILRPSKRREKSTVLSFILSYPSTGRAVAHPHGP